VSASVVAGDAVSFRRPGFGLLALEAPRAAAELGAFAAALPLLRRAPRGDGHPVVVFPGFMASDRSTRPLRWFLRDRGYHVHGWRLGANLGPTDHIIEGLGARLTRLREIHGGSKLSLIGWSLGGIYAREIARTDPGGIRQVITLGSPFRLTDGDGSHASGLYETISPLHSGRAVRRRPPERQRPPLRVPSTAIYSRSDGIAAGESCHDGHGELRECVEVIGSHCGLGHHPAVLFVIADRLAQPDGAWQPFSLRRLLARGWT
jgi:pimeloyl-ACP methyl ester carboxylesterase